MEFQTGRTGPGTSDGLLMLQRSECVLREREVLQEGAIEIGFRSSAFLHTTLSHSA